MIALLIDIGNTRVKWRMVRLGDGTDEIRGGGSPGWVSAEEALRVCDVGTLEAAFRAATNATADPAPVAFTLVANVASDAVGHAVQDAVSAVWPASPVRFARPGAALGGLVNAYRDPLQLGVDRWLAAVAAHALFPDRSLLVCSFGTATTIDLVEAHRFVGGLIFPGVEAMQNSLAASTARLSIGAGQLVDFGDRTEDAIASGVLAAQIGAVERTLRKVRNRRGPEGRPVPPLCIVAGGRATSMAPWLADLDTPYRVDHDLVLQGLAAMAAELTASQEHSSMHA